MASKSFQTITRERKGEEASPFLSSSVKAPSTDKILLVSGIRMEPTVPTPSTSAIVRARLASVLWARGGICWRCIVRVDRAHHRRSAHLVMAAVTLVVEATTTAIAATSRAGRLIHDRLRDIVVHALPTSRASRTHRAVTLVVAPMHVTAPTTTRGKTLLLL